MLAAARAAVGRFESLGVPVRVGGLMGCIVGPDGRGGEALYFNFNQTAGSELFVFDPQAMKVVRTITLPGKQVEISLGRQANGPLVGLAGDSVYVVDPVRGELSFVEKAPVPVRCGFALTDEAVYFGSGGTLWRCWLPRPVAATVDQSGRPAQPSPR